MQNKIYSVTKKGKEAKEAILKGMKEVSDAVSPTIGGAGRNAVYRDIGPTITNDGVSIARRIHPKDDFERLGAEMLKQAAEETNKKAGDGSSTFMILAEAMTVAGLEEIKNKNPMVVRKQLEKDSKEVIDFLKEGSKPIETEKDILNVAKISVEDEDVAKKITEAVEQAGNNGTVIVEEGQGYDIEIDTVKGYFWDRGYVSPYFATNEKMESVLEDVTVLVTDRYMNRNLEIMGAINELHMQGAKSFFIIADKMEGELLQTLITNQLNGKIRACVAVRPPSDLELEDVASITGATAITREKGIREIKASHAGTAKKVIVTGERTIIISDDSVPNVRAESVKTELKEEKDEDKQKSLKERLSKLTDGMTVLRVGAKTETERKYLALKIEDAVNAVLSAKSEGVVKGGGVALYEIAQKIKNPILKKALVRPYQQILENAGIKPDGKQYDVLKAKPVKDMFTAGIIDPAKVERYAVESAVSLASTVLTLESLVAHFREEPVESSPLL